MSKFILDISLCSPIYHDRQHLTPHAFEIALDLFNKKSNITINDVIEPLVQFQKLLQEFTTNNELEFIVGNISNFFNQYGDIISKVDVSFNEKEKLDELHVLFREIDVTWAAFSNGNKVLSMSLDFVALQLKNRRICFEVCKQFIRKMDDLRQEYHSVYQDKTSALKYCREYFSATKYEYFFKDSKYKIETAYLSDSIKKTLMILLAAACDEPNYCKKTFVKNNKEALVKFFSALESKYNRTKYLLFFIFSKLRYDENLRKFVEGIKAVSLTDIEHLHTYLNEFVNAVIISNGLAEPDANIAEIDTDTVSNNVAIIQESLLAPSTNDCLNKHKENVSDYIEKSIDLLQKKLGPMIDAEMVKPHITWLTDITSQDGVSAQGLLSRYEDLYQFVNDLDLDINSKSEVSPGILLQNIFLRFFLKINNYHIHDLFSTFYEQPQFFINGDIRNNLKDYFVENFKSIIGSSEHVTAFNRVITRFNLIDFQFKKQLLHKIFEADLCSNCTLLQTYIDEDLKKNFYAFKQGLVDKNIALNIYNQHLDIQSRDDIARALDELQCYVDKPRDCMDDYTILLNAMEQIDGLKHERPVTVYELLTAAVKKIELSHQSFQQGKDYPSEFDIYFSNCLQNFEFEHFYSLLQCIKDNAKQFEPYCIRLEPKFAFVFKRITCSEKEQGELDYLMDSFLPETLKNSLQLLISAKQKEQKEEIHKNAVRLLESEITKLLVRKEGVVESLVAIIEHSEVLNKEREKTYIALCLEKLIDLNYQHDNNNLISNSHKYLESFEAFFKDSKAKFLANKADSKGFLAEIQNWLNSAINLHTHVDEITASLSKKCNILKNNTPKNPVAYLKSINSFYKSKAKSGIASDKQLLSLFTELFVYFSWRNTNTQSDYTSILDDIDESLREILEKINMDKCLKKTKKNPASNEKEIKDVQPTLGRLRHLIVKRSAENQLQEEFALFENKNNEHYAELKTKLDTKFKSILPKINEPVVSNSVPNNYTDIDPFSLILRVLQETSEIENSLILDVDGKSENEYSTLIQQIKKQQLAIENNQSRYLNKYLIINSADSIINDSTKLQLFMQHLSSTSLGEDNSEQAMLELIVFVENILLPKIKQLAPLTEKKQVIKVIKAFKEELLNKIPKFKELDAPLKRALLKLQVSDWAIELDGYVKNNFYAELLTYLNYDYVFFRDKFEQLETLLDGENLAELNSLEFVRQAKIGLANINIGLGDLLADFKEIQEQLCYPVTEGMTKFQHDSAYLITSLENICELQSSLQTLVMFVGQDNFDGLTALIKMKLFDAASGTLTVVELVALFDAIINFSNPKDALAIMQGNNVHDWTHKLYYNQITCGLEDLASAHILSIDKNGLPVTASDIDCLIEERLYSHRSIIQTVKHTIETSITKVCQINQPARHKEILLKFIAEKLHIEVNKKSADRLGFSELGAVFQLLQVPNICAEIRMAIMHLSAVNDLDENDDDYHFLVDLQSKSFVSIKPWLYRLWLSNELNLNVKASPTDKKNILGQLETIKDIYSETLTHELITLINHKSPVFLHYDVLELLRSVSEKIWLLDESIITKLYDFDITQWHVVLAADTERKRSKARSLDVLIDLIKKEAGGVNRSLASLLTDELKLKKDIEDITLQHKLISTWDKNDITRWAKVFKGEQLLNNVANIKEAMAVVSRAIQLFEGFYPRDTQLIAAWLFLNPELNQNNGTLGQIATGEGKSVVVAIIAVVKALGCQRVDIVTSSSVLAIRDADKYRDFFEYFDLQINNNCDTACENGEGALSAEEVRQQRYCSDKGPVDIIYGEAGCFERDILLTEFNKSDPKQNIIGKRMQGNAVASIIIDEVDSMLLDKAGMVLYLSHNISTLRALERVFVAIWQTVNHPQLDNMPVTDDIVSYVCELLLEQITKGDIDIPKYSVGECKYMEMHAFVRRRMPVWVRSAFEVKFMVPNDSYVVAKSASDKNDYTITVMDKETGTEQATTHWSNGIHQFLQLKHTRRLSPETLKAVFISNMNFFKRYGNNISGLTGSLGSQMEQDCLHQVFNVSFFNLPRFKPELFWLQEGKVFTSRDEWCNGLEKALKEQINNKRAVLVICENINDVLTLKNHLIHDYPNIRVYYSSSEEFDVDKLCPGDIIIATNLAGRGTDLDTSVALEKNGGLHVITAYMPSNIRIEVQAFGRTARKGNKGTGAFVINNQYGLSIIDLKQIRDAHEKARLTQFIEHDLVKIKVEEKLLQKFSDLFQHIECMLRKDNDEVYIQYQLYSLKNRWAFWLDAATEAINMVNVLGEKVIFDRYAEFQHHVMSDMQTESGKLIKEPVEWMKLGEHYCSKESWLKAAGCYEQAAKDPFYTYAEYYAAACKLNYGDRTLENKKIFRTSLKKVSVAIDKEMQFVMQAGQLAFNIGEKNRQEGAAGYGNEYDKQLKEKAAIWNIFSSSISNSLGTEISLDALTSNKYLDKEKASNLLKTLVSKDLIKAHRVSKKFNKAEFKLPALFNHEAVREPVLSLLQQKCNNRSNGSNAWKLDLDLFQSEANRRKIPLPCLSHFLTKMENMGFIERKHDIKNDSNLLIKTYQLKHNKILQERANSTNTDKYRYQSMDEIANHYQSEFKKEPLAAILIKAAVQQSEEGDFLILKEIVSDTDFSLFKTQKEAAAYLWGFLKSEGVIKGNSVIGFKGSELVEARIKTITETVTLFLKNNKIGTKDARAEAIDSISGVISQSIGLLKKLPDHKTMVSFLNIQKKYYLDNNKLVPEGLNEFIELALGTLLSLQEAPPAWYEIAAVIVIGMAQIIAGTLIKTLFPVAGEVLGNFLINTGCDDVFFAVECAIKGEFSWDKYWEHKKQSMISSALTASFAGAVSFLKQAKKLKSFQKVMEFQKLNHAQKLENAANGLNKTVSISGHVAKEIGKNIVETGLTSLCSTGIDGLMKKISATYEVELDKTIAKSINDNFSKIEQCMNDIFAINESEAKALIQDCIDRRLANLSKHTMLRQVSLYTGPAVQGIVQGFAGKGFVAALSNFAPSLANIGIEIAELCTLITGFIDELHQDLNETKLQLMTGKKLKNSDFVNFKQESKNNVTKQLQMVFKQTLNQAVVGPILKHGANMTVSSVSNKFFKTNDVEHVANNFEMSHAINFKDATKKKYLDKFSIFKAKAQPVNPHHLRGDEKHIYPVNADKDAHGKPVNLEQIQGLYGSGVALFVNNLGEHYIQRPSRKTYCDEIRMGKPAGTHEQIKIAEILACQIERTNENPSMQSFVLKREKGKNIDFVIQKNSNGVGHALLNIDGELHDIHVGNIKNNDCFYNVAWVANEMSQGKNLHEACSALTHDTVQQLRKKVASAVWHDPDMSKQIRDANRLDMQHHYKDLAAGKKCKIPHKRMQKPLPAKDKKEGDIQSRKKDEPALAKMKRPVFTNKTKKNIPLLKDQDRRHVLHYSDTIKRTLDNFYQVVEKREGNAGLAKRADQMLMALGEHSSLSKNIHDKYIRIVTLMNSHEGNLIPGDNIYNQAIEKTRSFLERFQKQPFATVDELRTGLNEGVADLKHNTPRRTVTYEHLDMLRTIINDPGLDIGQCIDWIACFRNSATLDIAHSTSSKEQNISGLKHAESVARADTILTGLFMTRNSVDPTMTSDALDMAQEGLLRPYL